MLEALEYPFFRRALLAGLLASVACGVVGTYVVVKRMASISGGLAHAAFGGVGIAYYLGWSPTLGATGFALLCGLGLGWAYRALHASFDTLIAMLWAVGMAVGILFVSLTPGYAPDLLSYLFGNILFVHGDYLRFVAGLDLVILLVVVLLFKELQALAFDEEFSEVVGVRTGLLLTTLIVVESLAVVVLIRVVGIILAIALLTVPAAVARQWAPSLGRTMALAVAVGGVCTTGGLFLAYFLSAGTDLNVPPGPVIILLAVALYGVSSAARLLVGAR